MLIYIAGPYSASTEEGIQAHINEARAVAEKLALRGHHFICPHLNTAGMHKLDVPIKFWYEMDIDILRRCDAILMMHGWNSSFSAAKELEIAGKLGIQILSEGDIL